MPLFLDRFPLQSWTDASRSPPLTYCSVVVPIIMTEPYLAGPPAVGQVQEWVLDTGNRGEAFAWPLIGIRALRSAGLKVEIDFAHDLLSVWTPDPVVSAAD